MPVINHIHTYVKYKTRPGYFRCSAPDCTHFLDKERTLGRYSLCTECGSRFILTREDLKRVHPKCLNCANTIKARAHQKAQAITKYLGTDQFPFSHVNIPLPQEPSQEDFDKLEKLRSFLESETSKREEEP